MKQVLAILFATAFTFSTCLLAGKLILQILRVKLARTEECFAGFVVGAACLSTLVVTLTAAGQAHRGTFLALGLVIIALAVRSGAHRFGSGSAGAGLTPVWKTIFAIAYGSFAVLYIATALLPETSPDGVSYHLAFVSRYLREHHLSRITTNFTANYPEGMEMLFLFAFAFGKHSAAAMVHLLFLLITPFGLLAYGRRIGSPMAGAAGGLLFFLSPIVGCDGTCAYVDVALASVVFATFLLIEIWREERQDRLLIPIGLCAGFAYAIKYTGAVAILYAIGAIVFFGWKHRRRLRAAGIVIVFSALVASPWAIKNALIVGNPVSPFANVVFPNPYVSAWSEKIWTHAQRVRSGVTLAGLPLELTAGGSRLYGVIGPVFLLSPLLLLGLGRPAGRRLAFAALLFAIPCIAAPETRYWIPALVFAGMGMALALARWRAALVALVLVQAFTCWPPILRGYAHPYAWMIGPVDWKVTLRITPEEEYLHDHLPDYQIGRVVEGTVPPGQLVFSFSGIQQAYQSREVIVEWTSSFGIRTSETLRAAFDKTLQPTARFDFSFPTLHAQKIRIVQAGRSETDRWNLTEVHVYKAGIELARSAQWRLRASTRPWDVQFAFDNSPVTRWTSYTAFDPGMFIEIDFGRPEFVDRVTADCARDQAGMAMHLEYEAAPGDWRSIAASSRMETAPISENLRRAAIEEVEHNGIHWLLVNDLERDRGASDFFHYQKLWGIRLAAAEGHYKLYHLE